MSDGNPAISSPDSRFLVRGSPAYRRASLALFAAGFATFSSIYSVQPLMPEFSREFGVSAAVSSLSLSATTGILAFVLFLAGLMSGALNRKWTMALSLLGIGLFSLIVAVAPGWPALLTARALQGVVLGGVPALALAYLSEEIQPSALGSATGLYIAGTAIGGMSGRVITGLLAEAFDWRVAIAVLGVVSFAAAGIFVWLLPRSRNFVPRHGLTMREHIEPIVAHLRHPALPWVFLYGFLLMGAFVSIYNYVAYRLTGPPFSLGQGAIGSVFAVYIVGVFTSVLAGRVADRMGRPPVLVFAIVLMAVGLAIMWPDSLVLIIIGIGLVTIGFFAGHSTASGWVGWLARHGKGHAAGLYLLGYYLGSSVLGTVGGVFWNSYGWPGVVVMVAAILLVGLCLTLYLMHWQRRGQDYR